MIDAVRAVGARVFLISDGDVAGAIAAATPRSGVDLLLGIGGTPEGVIAAAALKCLGGAIQGRLWPRDDQERATLLEQGFDLDRVLGTDDLVSGDEVFFAATGITDGSLLARREVLARRRHHAFHGDALALGNRPLRGGRASVPQTRTILGDRVPPVASRSPEVTMRKDEGFDYPAPRTNRPEGVSMAEKTILVCDTCSKPAAETVTIRTARGNFVKDLCSSHVNELTAGARKPRRGRPRATVGAAARKATTKKAATAKRATGAAPKRRGRPRKKPA